LDNRGFWLFRGNIWLFIFTPPTWSRKLVYHSEGLFINKPSKSRRMNMSYKIEVLFADLQGTVWKGSIYYLLAFISLLFVCSVKKSSWDKSIKGSWRELIVGEFDYQRIVWQEGFRVKQAIYYQDIDIIVCWQTRERTIHTIQYNQGRKRQGSSTPLDGPIASKVILVCFE